MQGRKSGMSGCFGFTFSTSFIDFQVLAGSQTEIVLTEGVSFN